MENPKSNDFICECGSMATVIRENKNGIIEFMCENCNENRTAEQAILSAAGESDAKASFEALNKGGDGNYDCDCGICSICNGTKKPLPPQEPGTHKWQHEDTGRLVDFPADKNPGKRWHRISDK